MNQPTDEEFAAMRKAWRPWSHHGWSAESFALGWFLCLGYKTEVARRAANKVSGVE
jgi:hypothetical protein